jgi:hypothetical protein
MPSIRSLKETSPNHWVAKYDGNYGVYTIKITTNGEETKKFSCSCPSDYYPCKHIPMVEEAIAERIAKKDKAGRTPELSAEAASRGSPPEEMAKELLKNLSREELYSFVIKQLEYNPDLTNAVMFEYSDKITSGKENKYSIILRKTLDELEIDEENYCRDDAWLTINIMDQWFEKARSYIERNYSDEAILIAKACIEELALWRHEADEELIYALPDYYLSTPFKILEEAAADTKVNKKDLYNYCIKEMQEEKYEDTDLLNYFNDLLMVLAQDADHDGFIALQDAMLEQIEEKSSHRAEIILQRKIDFYISIHKPKKAWEIIENNIQIENFRKKLIEKN